jgi:hypothetical protein
MTETVYEMAGAYVTEYENKMEKEIINRALSVINSKPEWIEYVINFMDPNGFMFNESPLLDDIKDAIDEENPIHSGASLAICLQKCRQILSRT